MFKFKVFLSCLLSLISINLNAQGIFTFGTSASLPYNTNTAPGTAPSSGCATVGLSPSTYQGIPIPVSGLPNPLSLALGLFSIDITLDNSAACGTNINSLGFYLAAPDGRCMTIYSGSASTTNYDKPGPITLSFRESSCLIHADINTGVTYNNISFTTGGNHGTFKAGVSTSTSTLNNVYNNPVSPLTPLNPNGTWFLYVFESSVSANPCITKANLVFANTNVQDRTQSGDNCATPIVFNGQPFCATTNNQTPSSLMPGSFTADNFSKIGGATCDWNGARNNEIWIRYDATKNEYVCLNFSGIFGRYTCNEPGGDCPTQQQSIVVTDANADNDNNPCTQLNNLKTSLNDPYWNVVSCPTLNNAYTTTAGTAANQQHCFDAQRGKSYYLVIDGTSGSTASFYISGISGPTSATLKNNIIQLDGDIIPFGNSLRWTTGISPESISYFELERSFDKQNYHAINKTSINVSEDHLYRFDDKSPLSGNNYYRVKITFKNQTFLYSDIIMLKSKANLSVTAFPNPVVNTLTISAPAKIDHVNVFNSKGQVVYTDTRSGFEILRISTANWSNGQYILVVTDLKGNTETIKVVK